VQEAEYLKMDAVEERMFFYRALHERLRICLDRFAPHDAAVLDAGCGTGGFLQKLQHCRPSLRLQGVDVSPTACRIAHAKTGLPVEEGSVEALPFGDEQFDAIVSADVLYMLDEAEPALREFRRCLRPGGVVVLNLPAYEWLRSYHDEAVGTKHRFNRRELVALLERSGFSIAFAGYWNALLFPLAVLKRKLALVRPAGSDVKVYPAVVEAVFGAILAVEALPFRRGIPLPFGLSVLAVAHRS
jgi:SAM-dependent methyltransferase